METDAYVPCPFCRGAPDYHFAHCPMHDAGSCELCSKIGRLASEESERAA